MNAALTLAAEHDRAGRHDDAVNALARATQAGDLDAMTELGKRLIVGDKAPLLPQDGADLLLNAARAGNAEAALRLATLTALGAHVKQDWSEALALLVFAAERGSDSARGQLEALSGRSAETGDGEHQWRRFAEGIDLRFWLSSPPGQTLCPDPAVGVFQNFVTDSVCAWLIERARPNLKRALIYDPVGGKDIADHMRTNSAAGFDLVQADLVQAAVQWRMSVAVGVPIAHMEGPTILHYAIGEQITNHYDFVNPRTQNYQEEIAKRGQRIITFLVYLNDDYEGGETDFPDLGLRYHGAKRDGIFFTNALPNGDADLRMVHAGLPPKDNEKWIVSQFIRNRVVLGARGEPSLEPCNAEGTFHDASILRSPPRDSGRARVGGRCYRQRSADGAICKRYSGRARDADSGDAGPAR
jgi:prolyl 4-hydroxylase